MPETKQRSFAETVIGERVGHAAAGSQEDTDANNPARERQSSSEAFSLQVIFTDGRRRQTFPWHLYGGHEWTDEGDMECIRVLFGIRALIVRGHDFEALDLDLARGKRSSIRQHNSRQVQLLRAANPEKQPIIVELETYPLFADLVNSIRGEEEHETGHAGRIRR